jgi:glycosyltransferase involved in cell wall biosynthesis
MKLLIVTQVIDKNHPILGFFHRWVEEFAKHCEKVQVICLQEGEHTLPANVTVYSLGKEKGKGKLGYLLTFYRLIFSLRHEYDSVFVHMNQIYVILGAPFWRALGKKVGLWYAHGAVPRSLAWAERMSSVIFTSTKEGFRLPSQKLAIVGQGIDTSVFTPVEKAHSDVLRLITVGRISPSKNIKTLLQAVAILKEKDIPFHFKIVGVATIPSEEAYYREMRQLADTLGLESSVEWAGAIPNHALPTTLQSADIFIHDGSTNSLDKALVEASLCGCTVVSSNPAYKAETETIAPDCLYNQGDFTALAEIITNPDKSNETSSKVRKFFYERYDVSNLISAIVSQYKII